MNRNGITTDLKTINLILSGDKSVENPDIKEIKSDLILSRNVNNYVQLLYTHPNEPIPIINNETFDLLMFRLEIEHQESKFKYFQKLNINHIVYCKDYYLQQTALIIDTFINQLFEKPNNWLEVDHYHIEEQNQILFARIFQRLRNEHSDLVHKFLPKCRNKKYFICFDTTDNSPKTCFDR